MTKVFLIRRISYANTTSNEYWFYCDKSITYSSGANGETVTLGKKDWVTNIAKATQFTEEEANEFLEAVVSLNPGLAGDNYFRIEEFQIIKLSTYM